MNEMLVSLELLMERKSKAPADVSDIFFDPLWYLVPNSREAQWSFPGYSLFKVNLSAQKTNGTKMEQRFKERGRWFCYHIVCVSLFSFFISIFLPAVFAKVNHGELWQALPGEARWQGEGNRDGEGRRLEGPGPRTGLQIRRRPAGQEPGGPLQGQSQERGAELLARWIPRWSQPLAEWWPPVVPGYWEHWWGSRRGLERALPAALEEERTGRRSNGGQGAGGDRGYWWQCS